LTLHPDQGRPTHGCNIGGDIALKEKQICPGIRLNHAQALAASKDLRRVLRATQQRFA
jgi:hypothetical protein